MGAVGATSVEQTATVAARASHAGFRPEIQALRAAAILSVLLFHLWPNRLTGGYLGVDVFFVISGFLITSHLLRDIVHGQLSLPRFWARRIRRLLPASLVVLFVTAIAVLVLVPQRLWQQYLSEIIASTVYAQNWFLAANSIDYLGAANEPSPVQHFWSLSTEEQFYIVWPILIALALLGWRLAKKRTADAPLPRRLLFAILLVVTLSSLAYAVYASATDPSPAFFATTTRAWEFGAGSLLAFAATAWLHGRINDRVRGLMAWAGWLTIAVSVYLFTDNTVHPGLLTVIPVAGTVLVIWAGASPSRLSPTAITRLRPVQSLGDISYSLYLWHWPFIVILPIVAGRDPALPDRLIIILAAVVLGYLSYRLIEKPTLRLPLTPRGSTRRWFIGALIAALVVCALPATGFAIQARTIAAAEKAGERLAEEIPECFGAAAVGNEDTCADVLEGKPLVPGTATAAVDFDQLTKGCTAQRDEVVPVPCDYVGGDGSGISVALVGDSHAAHLTALALGLADRYNWRLSILNKGRCPFTDAERTTEERMRTACAEWSAAALELLQREKLDLVVTSQVSGVEFATSGDQSSDEAGVAGLESRWSTLIESGTRVVAVLDNPRPRKKVQTCLEQYWPTEVEKCGHEAVRAFLFDPQVTAVEHFSADEVFPLDFSDLECQNGFCPAVIGAVNVYRDNNHLTDTFVKTLVPIAIDRIPASFVER